MTASIIARPIALVLVLAQMALVARAGLFVGTFPGDQLKPLCEGKPTNLTLCSHLDALLGQADDLVASGKCSEHIHLALKEFKELLGSESDLICTMDKAEKIKAYYLKYLDTSSGTGAMVKLPRSLRHFVLGYGMQVSNLCKKNMVKTAVDRTTYSLLGQDYFFPAASESSRRDLARLLQATHEPDEILLPSHLGHMLPSGDTNWKQLYLQVSDDRQAARVKVLCERRYRPIYEQFILPVTVLASIGLDYKDIFLRTMLARNSYARIHMEYWSQVVFICELNRAVEVIGRSEGDSNEILMLTQEEAEQKKREFTIYAGLEANENENDDIVQLDIQISSTYTLGQVVYNKNDACLVSAVKSFKTSKSEAERVRKRVLKISTALLEKEKSLKMRVSAGYQAAMDTQGDNSLCRPYQEEASNLEDIDRTVERETWGTKVSRIIKHSTKLAFNFKTGSYFVLMVVLCALVFII